MFSENLQKFLQQQQDNNLYRQRGVVDGPQGVEIFFDGKQYINFCSNDYLGLANHPQLSTAFKHAVDKYGVGSGASHLINGHSSAHHALEEELAEFVGRPRALLFSTGYMANLGVVNALTGKADAVFEDRLNHASLIDAGLLTAARLLRYRHADMSDLQRRLAETDAGSKLVVTDAVFSMDGDIAPLTDMLRLTQSDNTLLMLDDAHGIGVLGEHGAGTTELFNADTEQVPILVGTLGKALGTFGAFVAGSELLIETLIQSARTYIYTTAMPAAVAEATRRSLALLREESWRRHKLHDNIALFRRLAQQAGLPIMDSPTAIQPLLVGDVDTAVRLSHLLKQAGFLLSAIRPPTVPKGTARLRITLSAAHLASHIESLVDVVAQYWQACRYD